MRIFRPLKSDADSISLLNQPPICTPVRPAGSAFRPNSPEISSQSSCPPPNLIQAFRSLATMPKGTSVK